MDADLTVFQQIIAGSAPEEVRAAVAAGTIPIPPHETVAVLTRLVDDPVEEVRSRARSLAKAFPVETARELARDRRTGDSLLYQLIMGHGDDPLLTNIILNHPLLGEETMQYLIYRGSPENLRLIATLTPKLRAYPHLIDVLLKHHGLLPESREQLVFLAESIARAKEAPLVDSGEIPDMAAIEEAGLASVPEELHEEMTKEEEADAERKKGWFERILTMTVGEKIYWAMKGNKEVRMNLVRDANKMVSLSVMKSPRITLGEIETIANSTNISADVLRAVAVNREWISKYPIQRNLAKNPKTPPGITVRLLPRLNKTDLQTIVSSKGMAEIVRSTAAKLVKGGDKK
jgi:hypothetical protein